MGELLYALHVLGAVLWVGGLATMLLVVRPALMGLEPPQRVAVHRVAMQKFFLLVWHAMPIVLLSGYGLVLFWFGGFGATGWHVRMMHGTGLLMTAIFLYVVLVPWKVFRQAVNRGGVPTAVAALGRIRQLVLLNLVLGVLTVAVAAWGRFGG